LLLQLLFADPQPGYQEIAALIGMPIGSIGPTRARCLAVLRAYIQERPGVLEWVRASHVSDSPEGIEQNPAGLTEHTCRTIL
jgi:hypothetical protein